MAYSADTIRATGQKLKALRNKYGWTMYEVEARTRKRAEAEADKAGLERESDEWREAVANGTIFQTQVSRIERGAIKRPPSVDDLAPLAAVYNLTVEDISEWYGVPIAKVGQVSDEPVMTRIMMTLSKLPKGDARRKALLDRLEFALDSIQANV